MSKSRRTVYVAGWQRSGTTWLSWLLGDALNCPVGTFAPHRDKRSFVAEGSNRPQPFFVRRGHFRLIDKKGGPVAPSFLEMAWPNLTNEILIFIVRDPRDTLVSAAHYWKKTPEHRWKWMRDGAMPGQGWAGMVRGWLDAPVKRTLTRYEWLLEDCAMELKAILLDADLPCPRIGELNRVCKRQSFSIRSRRLERVKRDGRNPSATFFWRGKIGNWADYISRDLGREIERDCGELMRELGYETDPDWWRRLPERAVQKV